MSTAALVPVLVVLVVLASDAWVYRDQKMQSAAGHPVVFSLGKFRLDSPTSWFVGCLVMWIVFFPLYVIGRRAE